MQRLENWILLFVENEIKKQICKFWFLTNIEREKALIYIYFKIYEIFCVGCFNINNKEEKTKCVEIIISNYNYNIFVVCVVLQHRISLRKNCIFMLFILNLKHLLSSYMLCPIITSQSLLRYHLPLVVLTMVSNHLRFELDSI